MQAESHVANDMLPCPEAADVLGVSERWVRRAVAERRIPFVKVGRLIRFRRSDLDAYIAANTVEASA